jgi:hypothetical protein
LTRAMSLKSSTDVSLKNPLVLSPALLIRTPMSSLAYSIATIIFSLASLADMS